MRLWLVRPRAEVVTREINPWEPWFDKVFAFVIRAATKGEARALAQAAAGAEGRGIYQGLGLTEEESADDVWLDAAYSECLELDRDGGPEVILVDRRRG